MSAALIFHTFQTTVECSRHQQSKFELFHTDYPLFSRTRSEYIVHVRCVKFSPLYNITLNIRGFLPPKNKTYRAPPTQFIFLVLRSTLHFGVYEVVTGDELNTIPIYFFMVSNHK